MGHECAPGGNNCLDGASLTIEQVLAVAYGQPGVPRVVLSAAAITQVARCRCCAKAVSTGDGGVWHYYGLWRF